MATRSKDRPSPPAGLPVQTPDTAALLRELVAHLRQNRTQLREEWARRITRAQLLTAMTEAEIFAEATSAYDNDVEALETGTLEALQVRERLLILPIIGVIDPQRARQLTEQLLRAIRTNRAKVVVIDITGVAAMDSNVANHLVQTVEASRLLGATVIVTGLSPEIAQTLVTIGVDLSEMATVGDLQGGIEEAERLLGYKVLPLEDLAQKA